MKYALLALFILSCAGCDRTFGAKGGIMNSAAVEIFWKGPGNANSSNIEYIVLSDYNPGHTNNTSGCSIYASGYHDLDGTVVTFAKNHHNQVIILDKFFDLKNGRFFHVRRKDSSHLEVIQKSIDDPLAQEALKLR
jgi:hypothetical protein